MHVLRVSCRCISVICSKHWGGFFKSQDPVLIRAKASCPQENSGSCDVNFSCMGQAIVASPTRGLTSGSTPPTLQLSAFAFSVCLTEVNILKKIIALSLWMMLQACPKLLVEILPNTKQYAEVGRRNGRGFSLTSLTAWRPPACCHFS